MDEFKDMVANAPEGALMVQAIDIDIDEAYLQVGTNRNGTITHSAFTPHPHPNPNLKAHPTRGVGHRQ